MAWKFSSTTKRINPVQSAFEEGKLEVKFEALKPFQRFGAAFSGGCGLVKLFSAPGKSQEQGKTKKGGFREVIPTDPPGSPRITFAFLSRLVRPWQRLTKKAFFMYLFVFVVFSLKIDSESTSKNCQGVVRVPGTLTIKINY